MAVDLIRKYKDGGGSKQQPSPKEVDEVQSKIEQCQSAFQNELISADPIEQATNNHPMTLKPLKGIGQQIVKNIGTGAQAPNYTMANFESQASNILEMEKRYETPLKQPTVGSGNAMIQTHLGIR